MKISHIKLNCKKEQPVIGEISPDYLLFYFRSPVSFGDGSKQLRMKGGCAVIYSGGAERSFSSAGSHTLRFDVVSFRPSSSERSYLTALGIPLNTPIQLGDDFAVASALRSMKSRSMHRSRHFGEFAELSMRLIFIALSEECSAESPSPNETIPRYAELKALRSSIYDDPVNNWSADEICAELGVSRAYFHRLYLEAFGVTCRQDVIESRLLYAAELLKNTDLSVSSVAEQCGYDSDSYFMRQFKQHKGCTPSEYRRRTSEYEE